MQYKLINEKTKEEHICTLVTIDGFEYYIQKNNNSKYPDMFTYYLDIETNEIEFEGDGDDFINPNWREIIATNNPNINIPKIIDKVSNLSLQLGLNMYIRRNYDFEYGIIIGYNEAKDTYKFTEEDFLNFTEYYKNNVWLMKNTNKEILDIWKEQRIETIYYEI